MNKVQKKYSGVVVPMVTPFKKDYTVDAEAAKKIVKYLLDAGAIPFLLGSTGEGLSMSMVQKEELIDAVSKITREAGCELYVGISGNSLVSAVEEAALFSKLGATILVATLPFYYPIDEYQMTKFFTELADHATVPLMLYNMPGMVKRSIPLEVAEALSQHPNIVGLKDSERDEQRLQKSIQMWKDRTDFAFLIGWAAMSYEGMKLGADGIVPSTGNLVPELYVELYDNVLLGCFDAAKQLQETTNAISSIYQKDRLLSYSIPVLKKMMEFEGLCSANVLPPMYPMEVEEEKVFQQVYIAEYEKLKINEIK